MRKNRKLNIEMVVLLVLLGLMSLRMGQIVYLVFVSKF